MVVFLLNYTKRSKEDINLYDMKRFTLGVFDVDGTLIPWERHVNIWDIIIPLLGLEKYNNILMGRFKRNELSYIEWHEKLFLQIKKHGNVKDIICRNILEQIPNLDQTRRFLKVTSQMFKYKAILSGSLDLVLTLSKIDFDLFQRISIHSIKFNCDGILNSWEINPFSDGLDKFYGLCEICDSLGVDLSDTFYIGDGSNDLVIINELHKAGGKGFALPPLSNSELLKIPDSQRGNNLADAEIFLSNTCHN